MPPAPPADFLPAQRANAIARKLRAAFAKPSVTMRFNPSHETAKLAYFPPGLDEALAEHAPPGIRFATGEVAAADDVAIVTAQGADVSSTLWAMRLAGFGGVAVAWAWDNHLAPTANLATAIAADVVVPSHGPFASTLTNPVSIRTAPVHACAAQWTARDAAALFARSLDAPRGDRLFAPYVDYPFREHAALLHALDRDMMEAEILLMPPNDRRRYFGQSREARFAEWAARKVSLVLPVARDLSTRVFDALLAGQTLVVPPGIADLDAVIPPERQRELGIVRFARPDPASIREAWREALAAFESGGPEGARGRHDFVRGAHMLEHRVRAIAESLRRLADGTLPVRFAREPDGRAGLIADGNETPRVPSEPRVG